MVKLPFSLFFCPKPLIFAMLWGRMVIKVEESGRQWHKVVDKLITLWITTGRLQLAGECRMFMGEYNHTIDAKGRMIVPSKFRELLGNEFVVTKGLDGCLFVYPNEEWHNIEEKFRTVPLTTKDARKFSRFFFAGAAACEVDKQGRILIPPVLREFADIQKDIVSVGVLNRIEIWSKDRWIDNNTYDDMDEIAEHMAELGLSI